MTMSVKLAANDGAVVTLSTDAAKLSEYIRGQLLPDGSAPGEEIPCPGVNGEILSWAAEFLELRARKPMYPGAKTKRPLMDRENLTENGVDADFAGWLAAKCPADNSNILKMFALLEAGDFLGVEDLMDLAAMRVALRYLEWDYRERAGVFGVPEDMPAAEEEELKKEFAWALEEPDLMEDIKREQEAITAAAAAR